MSDNSKYKYTKQGEGQTKTIVPSGKQYKTDRIDFTVTRDGLVVVTQMTRYSFRRQDIPHTWTTYSANCEFNLHKALAWCEEHGFDTEVWPTSHTWSDRELNPIGARAWRGERWPIRTAYQIMILRQQLERECLAWRDRGIVKNKHEPQEPRWNLFDLQVADLAYVG